MADVMAERPRRLSRAEVDQLAQEIYEHVIPTDTRGRRFPGHDWAEAGAPAKAFYRKIARFVLSRTSRASGVDDAR